MHQRVTHVFSFDNVFELVLSEQSSDKEEQNIVFGVAAIGTIYFGFTRFYFVDYHHYYIC
jgi:hypothetical protein